RRTSRSINSCAPDGWCASAPGSRRSSRRWRNEATRADSRPPTESSGPAELAPMTRAAREILIRPLMTEKSMRQKEEHNAVAFGGPPVPHVRHARGNHPEGAGEEPARAQAADERAQYVRADHRAPPRRRGEAHAPHGGLPAREVRRPGARGRDRV